MIATISGTLNKIEKSSLIVGVGGVGVRLFVPRNVLEDAGNIGRSVFLFTHLVVRETELTLYGFESDEDLELFQILLAIRGIGPKVALAILGTLSPELLKSAVMRENTAVLQRVPGIGKKTAERIMFQLRDKLDLTQVSTAVPFISDIDADVIDVLTSLGFSIVESQAALQHVPREVDDINGRVQMALQYLDQ